MNRSYGDQCGVARSLDVIGERWALLVVRELLLGPKRFNDLLAGLPGASPNVISQRLRELTGAGVIRQRDLGPPVRVRRGTPDRPGAVLTTDADTLHAVVLGIRSIEAAAESARLRLDGDPHAISGLTGLLHALLSPA